MSGSKPLKIRLATRLRKNRLFSAALAATGSELREKKWLFILGCYNSGTTLLEQVLSGHPEISGMGDEGVMLTDALPRPEDFGWRRMWWQCEDALRILPAREYAVANRVKRQWSHFLKKEEPFAIEKSISNVTRVPFLQEHFVPAYFVHIVRNGYAVAEGIRRKSEVMQGNPYALSGQYPIELCAGQWTRSLQVIEDARANLTRFMEIRYEDFTIDPVTHVNEICRFLGITPFSETLASQRFLVHGKRSSIRDMNESSLQRLSGDDRKKIRAVANDYLTRYGYPIL